MGQNEQRALLAAIMVLAFSTLALASAPRWAASVSAALAILTVVPFASSRRILSGYPALLLLLGIPFFVTAFQLLPLPALLVKWLAPGSYELARANSHAYAAAMPGLLPISQDWPGTLVELAKLAGYLAFAGVCTRLCISRRARRLLLVSVASVGTLVALCALGHRAAGAHKFLGFYVPELGDAYRQSFSPFLNPNHLAGYMAFVTPVCLGLALHRKSWIFFLMAAVCAATALQAVSRGGLISLSVGLLVTMMLVARVGRSSGRRGRGVYWLALALGLGFVALAVFGVTAGQELLHLDLQREQDVGKALAWRSVPELLATSPWFGIGRGAFEFSFTSVQPAIGVTYSHIENEYLQVLLDWGVLGALAMSLAGGLVVREIYRRGITDPLACGAVGATVALLVQSLVDFGLELPGMAFPAIAVLATLLPGRLIVVGDEGRKRALLRLSRLAAVMICVLLCTLAASSVGARPKDDIAARPEFDRGYTGSADAIVAETARLSRRHPASYLLAAESAQALLQLRDPRAFAALARALDLNPKHFGVHLLAARLLESSQEPRQALAEYREALRLPGGPQRKILESLVAHFPASEDLVLALPTDHDSAANFARELLLMKRADAAELFLRDAIALGNPGYELYKIAVQAGIENQNTPWAVSIAQQAHERFVSDESLLLYVAALRAASLPLLAIAALDRHIATTSANDLSILSVLCQLQLDTEDFGSARATANRLLMTAGSPVGVRKSAHGYLATIEEHEGNRHQALWHRQQAADLRER